MARGCVTSGISNGGFPTGENKLSIRGGVFSLLGHGPSVALPDDDGPQSQGPI